MIKYLFIIVFIFTGLVFAFWFLNKKLNLTKFFTTFIIGGIIGIVLLVIFAPEFAALT